MKEKDLRQVAIERISQFVLKWGERFFEQQSILIDYLRDSIQSFDVPHSYCDGVNAKGSQAAQRVNKPGNVLVTLRRVRVTTVAV
jgi:hypothetical protein